ncbi:MAG: hypothetical protein ABFE02_14330 [Sulfuricella sp.]
MKNKFLLAVAWLFIALATISGKLAYADMAQAPAVTTMSLACTADNDWNFNDALCHPRIAEGKAAYGEPTGMTTALPDRCTDGNDWAFNDPGCNPRRDEGKAAFGESTGMTSNLSTYCLAQLSSGNDWNFKDPDCPK